jgi:hypothetical protein
MNVNWKNGWIPLVQMAIVGIACGIVTTFWIGPEDWLFSILRYAGFYFLVLGFIGGWIWMPIAFYIDYKEGNV